MRTIPFSRPAVGEEEIEAVAAVLRSGWLTTGEQAIAFEAEFAAVVGSPHAMAVNSATAGLHLALEAAGVGPGDSVILPSMTFTATAEVVRYLGGEVVFADIGPTDLLISPASIAERAEAVRRSGGRVAAIVPVHLAGEACDMAAITAIAREHDAVVVEDAAHAFPGTTEGGHMGTLGDIGVYSFYANKTITTGEGGMVVTGDTRIAARIRTMRNHGIDREAWHRYTATSSDPSAPRPWYYEVVAPGYKYNLPDTAAAIGRVQLRRAEAFLAARRTQAHTYREALAPLERRGYLHLPRDGAGHAWHLFVIRLDRDRSPVSRDLLAEQLRTRGIGTSVHYIPLHRMPYWRDRYPDAAEHLPNTDARYEEILSVPLYPDLSTADHQRVVAALGEILGGSRDGS